MPDAPRPRPRRRLRTLARRLAGGAIVVLALLVVAFVFRNPLFGGLLAERVAAELGSATGARVTVERVSGGWLSDLTLHGIEATEWPPESPLSTLTIDRVEARFRLLDLLDDAVAGLDGIDLQGADVLVDLTRSRADEDGGAETDVVAVLRTLPPITVNGDVTLRAEHGELTSSVSAALRSADGAPRLELTATGFGLDSLELSPADATAEPGAWSGAAMLTAGGAIRIDSISSAGVTADVRDGDLTEFARLLRPFVGDDVDHAPPGTLTCKVHVGAADGTRLRLESIDARVDWSALGPTIDRIACGALEVRDDDSLRAGPLEVGLVGGTVSIGAATWAAGPVPDSLSLRDVRLMSSDPLRHARELGLDLPSALETAEGPLQVTAQLDKDVGGPFTIETAAVTWKADTPTQSRVELSGSVTIDDNRGALLDLSGTADLDAGSVAGLAPEDWLLPTFAGRLDGTADVELTASGLVIDGRFASEALSINDRAAREVVVEASYEADVLRITDVHATTDFGVFAAGGDIDIAAGAVRDGAFRIDVPDLGALRELFPRLPDVAGSFAASGTVSGGLQAAADAVDDPLARWPADLRVAAAVSAQDFEIDGAAIGRLEGAARLDGPRLDVERLDADGALGRLRVTGTANLVSGAVSVPGFALAISDVSALAPWAPAVADVTGGGEIDGSFSRASGVRWIDSTARITLRAPDLGIGENQLRDVILRAAVARSGVAVDEVRAVTPWGDVSAAGSFDVREETGRGRLTRLDVDVAAALLGREGAPLPVRLRGPCDVAWTADAITFEALDAAALGGRVRGSGRWAGDLSLDLTGDALDAAQLATGAEGRISVELAVRGDPTVPDVDLVARSDNLTWEGTRGELDVRVRQDVEGLHAERLHIDCGALVRVSGGGYAPIRYGVDGLLEIAGRPASLRLEAASTDTAPWLRRLGLADLSIHSATVDVRAEDDTLRADATLRDAIWRTEGVDDGPRLDGATTVQVRAGPSGARVNVRGGETALRVEGQVDTDRPFDWRDPADLESRLLDAPLRGQVRVDAPDIRALSDWIEALHHITGSASADVTLAGTARDPRLSGVVEANQLTARLEGDLPAIDRGRARLVLGQDRRVVVETLTGRLGFAPFDATGHIDLPEDGPPVLAIHLNGENLLITRSRDVRMRADLDVDVTGPVTGLLVRGKARITDALVAAPMDLFGGTSGPISDDAFQLFSLSDGPFAAMRFDVRVEADDTVRVANNVLTGNFTLDMTLRGTGAVPEPEGRVDFRDTLVQLPLTRLRVDAGSLVFAPGAPFDPQLRVTAYTRLKGFDLDVQATGGLSDVRVHVASTPSLSQEDALLLLATGSAPADIARDGVTRVAVTSAGTLLGEAVFAWFTGPSDPEADSLADRVTVEVGRDRSESGAATIEAELELAPRWFLRLERDRWDEYDAGVLWRVRFR